MKRIVLMMFFALMACAGFAQSARYGYVTTKNNAKVYSKPNYKSRVAYWDGQVDEPEKVILEKGEIVLSNGKKQNGFVYVTGGGYHYFFEGWIPLASVRAAKKCSVCNGKGHSTVLCDCGGDGCGICHDSGYEECSRCGRYGFVE